MREKDGIDHINVYSRGATKIGRLLSNFAHTPFLDTRKVPSIGFASVEAFWYWHIHMKAGNTSHAESLVGLHGYKAKMEGQRVKVEKPEEPGKDLLRYIYIRKLISNPEIAFALALSVLPFEHYYVYADKEIQARKYLWTAKLWEQIRDDLKRKTVGDLEKEAKWLLV